MTILLTAVRIILAVVLLVAGAAKVVNPARTRQMLHDFMVPRSLSGVLAGLLPVAELGCGLALLPLASAWWGAVGALVLFLLFLAGIGWNLARGRSPECRCFGQLHSAPIGWRIVVRTLVLAGLAAVLVGREPQQLGAGLFDWAPDFSRADLLILAVGAVALGIAAIEAWAIGELVKQNGRLILRLDAMEGRPAAPASDATPPDVELEFGLPIGAAAPSFAFPALDGVTVSLSDLRAQGKPVLLFFMDPGCGPCAALGPDLSRWRREHSRALTMVMLSRGTPELHRARFTGQQHWTVLLQPDDDVAARYQALGTPSAVLVDTDGRIASPVAQGAGSIRRLVTRIATPPAGAPPARHKAASLATAGSAVLLATVLLGAARLPGKARGQGQGWGAWELQVESAGAWRTWWRADSAPEVWNGPLPLVTGAVRWTPLAAGAELGELVVSNGSLALRTRLILARFDPRRYRLDVVGSAASPGHAAVWTIDSAGPGAIMAFNGGQFGKTGPWGWLVRNGRQLQPPGRGPLSLAVAVTEGGAIHFISPDSAGLLSASEVVREAFQSYPALLVNDGRVPPALRRPGGPVDLGHRDTRLALCRLRDGQLLVALTRFDNLGRVFGGFPFGLTLGETAAVMGAVGCRQAVGLDGGLSAQLLVRPASGASARWDGQRSVPVGLEVRPR